MEVVVDFQAFRNSSNEYIIKEIAFLHAKEKQPLVYLIKPPFHWEELSPKTRATNNWLSRNYTHLSWASGDIDYNYLEKIINLHFDYDDLLYIQGSEKAKWMSRYARNIIEIANDTPSMKKLFNYKIDCNNHINNNNENCALRNVILLEKYLFDKE